MCNLPLPRTSEGVEALNVFWLASLIASNKNLRETVVKDGIGKNINRIEGAIKTRGKDTLDDLLNYDVRKTYQQQEATSVAQKSFAKTERRNLQMNVLDLVKNNLKNNKTLSLPAKAHILQICYDNMIKELRREDTALRTFFGTPSRLERILRAERNKVDKIAPHDIQSSLEIYRPYRKEIKDYLAANPLISILSYHGDAYPREKHLPTLHLRDSDIKQGIGKMGQGSGPVGLDTEKPKR